ncbi:Glycoprotein precursor [Chilibre virus]|uniref:Envelopment polyprotein n=1 Tax=Chilibre virus TaxID=629728 RepID=A0A4V1DW06_9VIRU|nr:Glycoprotein precursor [Chilibre virus]QCI62739.1 Glycoprotein precursor [Chilibre virus]
MKKIVAIIAMLMALTEGNIIKPESDYCFQGGRLSKKKENVRMGARQCIRDDVSMIKLIYTKTGNDTKGPLYEMQIYRKDTVKNWYTCNPKPVEDGPLQMLEIDDKLNMHFSHYACTKHCHIKIDKEYARIELTSSGLNYYEMLGTLNQKNWLMSKVHIDLSHTCENLIITCGLNTVQFHACFKQHMECNRFFKDTWLPSIIVGGFCSNIEFFLFFSFLFVCFSLLWLMAKTILCYFLIPIYLPIVYIYSKIYVRFFKICKSCGIAIHPLQPCGVECICGMIFESTEKLKRHRDSQLGCKGYKTGIAARRACRSGVSNFGLALFLTVFLFLFLTPTIAVQIPISDGRVLDAEDIGESLVALFETVDKIESIQLYTQLICIILSFLTVIIIITKYCCEKITKTNIRKCRICKMLHSAKGLCTSRCICGFIKKDDNPDIYLQDLKTIVHTPSSKCFLKLFRKRSISMDCVIIFSLTMLLTILCASTAAEQCDSNLSKEKKYVCKCLQNQDQDVLALARDCLALSNSIDCGDAPAVIDALKEATDWDPAKEHILELTKYERHQLVEMQGQANTTAWFYTLEVLSAIVDCPTEVQKTSYLAELEINLKIGAVWPCDVTQKAAYSKQCDCMKGLGCEENNIQGAYQGKPEKFEKDLRYLIDSCYRLIPGGFQKIVFAAFKMKDESLLKYILDKLKEGVLQRSKSALGYIAVLSKSFSKDLVTSTEIPAFYARMVRPGNVSVNIHVPETEMQKLKHEEAIKICPKTSDWYTIVCIGITPRDNMHLLVCKSKANRISTGDLYEVSGNLCYKDQTCDIEMSPFRDSDMPRIKKLTCSKMPRDKSTATYINSKEMAKLCIFKSQGSCDVYSGENKVSRSVVQCGQDIIHADVNHLYQKPDSDHGTYCFDAKCDSSRAFINKFRIQNCETYQDLLMPQKDVLVKNYKNLDEYLEGIKDDLMHGLKVDKYLPTSGLPKHVPVYKHITVQGAETSEGITSSYIKFSMAAMTGSSAGFHITAPNGQQLFDVVVYIVNSEIDALYDFAYITGPTRTFRSHHDEHCTSSCPKKINGMPNEALPFFKERTSNWGCEEWGCLAINTGCLFGWCQDVIANEAKVYQKSTESNVKVKLCISLPTDTFCQDINGAEPVIGETVSAQLTTVQVEHFRTPILVRDGIVYYGQINNRGVFSPICGSVQKIRKRTFGVGVPQVDYTCHAAQRKDIIIRKCFQNSYKACSMLKQYDVLIGKRTNETITIRRNNLNLGNLEVKILLGDINFKQFATDVEIHFKAKCVGCIDCIDGISCNIEIHHDKDLSCPIRSEDCELFYDNLLILVSKNGYDIKLKCQKKIEAIDLTICKTSQKVPLEIVQHKDKIEIDNNDSPTYIREEDLRCGTWLCKVYNEGLGGFTGLLKLIAGDYYYWAIGIIVAIVAFVVLVYLIMPLARQFLSNVRSIKELDDRRDEVVRRRLAIQKKKG